MLMKRITSAGSITSHKARRPLVSARVLFFPSLHRTPRGSRSQTCRTRDTLNINPVCLVVGKAVQVKNRLGTASWLRVGDRRSRINKELAKAAPTVGGSAYLGRVREGHETPQVFSSSLLSSSALPSMSGRRNKNRLISSHECLNECRGVHKLEPCF